MSSKLTKKILDTASSSSKRFKALCQFTEYGSPEEVALFYQQETGSFSMIYNLFLEGLSATNATAKSKKKPIPTAEVISLTRIILALFKHTGNIIQLGWQRKIQNLQNFVDDENVFAVKKAGFELLIHFIDIVQDDVDETMLNLFLHVLNFTPFARAEDNVKFPIYPSQTLSHEEKIKIQAANASPTEDEVSQLLSVLFGVIKTSDNFDFWWKFIKERIAPILYPKECKSLELMDMSDDVGFTRKCPCRIHLMVIDMILETLEHSTKANVLYSSFKDISLFLLIFRQSFSLAPQYYETVAKLIKVYHAWICKDSSFTNAWPEIMEQNCNIYYRVFIDNLSQLFFMMVDETSLELHIEMCNEVLKIFMHFTAIADTLDLDTSTELFKSHMRMSGHLVKKKRSDDKYEQEYGAMLERSCFRNLFIIWLKCHPQNDQVELWNSLLNSLGLKFTEPCVFHFWKITVLHLTDSMIKSTFQVTITDDQRKPYECVIYDSSGKRSKKPKFTPRTDIIDLKDFFDHVKADTALRMWHRMVNMFGSRNLLSEGHIHTQKLRVIGEILDQLLQISQIEVKVMKGTPTPDFVHSPETVHILHLFIEWILEACERNDFIFSEGRFIAFTMLCKLLCHKSSQVVPKHYLAMCYRMLHIGLNTELGGTPQTVEAILIHSYTIFTLGHPGAYILIPDYISAIDMILKDNSADKLELHVSAIHALVSVIHICYHYDTAVLPSVNIDGFTKKNDKPEVNTFRSQRDRIYQIIMRSVYDSKFEEVQVRCIWALFLIMQCDLGSTAGKKIDNGSNIEFTIDCLLDFSFDDNDKVAYASHSTIQAFGQTDMLQKLPVHFVSKVMTSLCGLITHNLSDEQPIRSSIVINIFYTIMETIVDMPAMLFQQLSITRALFKAVTMGINVAKNASGQDDEEKKKRIAHRRPDQDVQSENVDGIGEAAESLMAFILNMYNNFPSPIGATALSGHFSEFDILSEEKGLIVPSPKIHHFVFNDYSLLTVVESPDEEETVRVIMRDMTGKYCWEHKFIATSTMSTFKPQDNGTRARNDSLTDCETPPPSPKNLSPTKSNLRPQSSLQSEKGCRSEDEDDGEEGSSASESKDYRSRTSSDASHEMSHNGAYTVHETMPQRNDAKGVDQNVPRYDPQADNAKSDMLKTLQDYVSQVFPECAEFAKPSQVAIADQDIDISQEDELMENQTESERRLSQEGEFLLFQKCEQPHKSLKMIHRVFRTFLSSSGLLSLDNRATFVRLDANHKFYRVLKQLDKFSERETMKLGLIYVSNQQENERLIMRNEDSSPLYKEFTNGLGWSVDLSTHKGFLGGLDNSTNLSTGKSATYYSNATTEVIFHDLTRMPTKANDTQQIHKKRHVGNDMVHIVWSEHDRDYRPWTIMSQFNFVHIIIYPLKHSLFRVQIFTKPGVALFGPLLDGMVVEKKNLASLVRLTAINANKTVRYNQQGYKRPYPTRRNMIGEICDRYKQSDLSNEDYLGSLFFDQTNENVVWSAFERRNRGNTVKSHAHREEGDSEADNSK